MYFINSRCPEVANGRAKNTITILDPSNTDDQLASTSSETPRLTKHSLGEENSQIFISPEVFQGYPKAGERKLKNSQRKKATSCIPTDTIEKEKIQIKYMEKKENRKRKLEGKRKLEESKKQAASKNIFGGKRKSIPKNNTSSDDDEEKISFADSDDSTDWIPEDEPSGFEELRAS